MANLLTYAELLMLLLGALLIGQLAEDMTHFWPRRQPPPCLPLVVPHRHGGRVDGWWRWQEGCAGQIRVEVEACDVCEEAH